MCEVRAAFLANQSHLCEVIFVADAGEKFYEVCDGHMMIAIEERWRVAMTKPPDFTDNYEAICAGDSPKGWRVRSENLSDFSEIHC